MSHFNNENDTNVKGYRYIAAAVSFLEVLVYVVGLGLVMSSLDQIQNIFAYALGFSVDHRRYENRRKIGIRLYRCQCNIFRI